ncbi:hypothetical protein [Parabacteroides johnsonii]|nr:hypothetical protein [Parabacteroides johnsonii]
MKWNNKNERFVVFLDIMGFKDRVARTPMEKLYEQLVDFNTEIVNIIAKNKSEEVQLAQFSDSIVLFTNNSEKESLNNLSAILCEIMKEAIYRNIPLKGALAKGLIVCDMAKQLFFGQALIDAYLLEESVQFYGVAVHHTAEKDVVGMKEQYRDIKIPLKGGTVFHYTLVWWLNHQDRVKENLNNIRFHVSDSPRKYIDNTINVMS